MSVYPPMASADKALVGNSAPTYGSIYPDASGKAPTRGYSAPQTGLVYRVEEPERKQVLCAPCRPETYLIGSYLVLFEMAITMFWFFWVGTFLMLGIALLPLVGLGLPFLWIALSSARAAAKSAAWVYGGLGARVPKVAMYPQERGFFKMFASWTTWRCVLHTILVRPIVSFIFCTLLISFLVVVVAFIVSPVIVVIVFASHKGVPSWTVPVAIFLPLGGCFLGYLSLLAAPACAAVLAAFAHLTVGSGDVDSATVALYLPTRSGDMPLQVHDASPDAHSSATAVVAMYNPSSYKRAYLIPSRPRRSARGRELCGSMCGVLLYLLCSAVLLVLGVAGTLAVLASINCQHTSVIQQDASFLKPANGVPMLLGADMAHSWWSLSSVHFADNASGFVNATALPAGSVGMYVTTSAYGDASALRNRIRPHLAVTASSLIAVSRSSFKFTSLGDSIEFWLACPSTRVTIVIPKSVPAAALTDIEINVNVTNGEVSVDSAMHLDGLKSIHLAVTNGDVDLRQAVVDIGVVDVSVTNGVILGTNITVSNGVLKVQNGALEVSRVTVKSNGTLSMEAHNGAVELDHLVVPASSAVAAVVNVMAVNGHAEVDEIVAVEGAFAGTVTVNAPKGRAQLSNYPKAAEKKEPWTDSYKMIVVKDAVGGSPHKVVVASEHGEAEVERVA